MSPAGTAPEQRRRRTLAARRLARRTHPLGQIVIAPAGCGRAQRMGGPIEDLRPGDRIWFPSGAKHEHDAAATTTMTHSAIQEQRDGTAVDWMEKVSDEHETARQAASATAVPDRPRSDDDSGAAVVGREPDDRRDTNNASRTNRSRQCRRTGMGLGATRGRWRS